MAEINDAYAALIRGPRGRADRPATADAGPTSATAGAASRVARRGRSPRGPSPAASTRPRPSGHATRPSAAVGRRPVPSRPMAGGQPPLRGERSEQRAAARVDADRAAGARPAPQLPAPASHRRLDVAREHVDRVRQVPRPHARPDRGVRAVLHRLGGRHRDPRPGSRRRGPGRPGRPRRARGRRAARIPRRRTRPLRLTARSRPPDGDPARKREIAPRIPGGRSADAMLAMSAAVPTALRA